MRLVLLRHGRTEANELRLYCGWSDVPLSLEGRQDLDKLRNAGIYPDVSKLKKITSGMLRTDETLKIICGDVPDVRIAEFKEMNFGKFEMHSYAQLKEDPEYQAWIADESGCVPTPGGESADEFKRRIMVAADALNEDTLLVCHGGVIAALMQRWFPEENRNMYDWQPMHGLGYEVEFCSDGAFYRRIGPEC